MAAADPEASLEAADTLLDLLNGERVSPEGAAEWVTRGLDVLERNKEVGRGYFRLGSKYSLQVLEELKEGLALKSVARVLKLYATALSGHEVAIRGTTEMQAVDAFGADHIILPPEMHFLEDDDGNFTAYKVATAHGAGRIEFGTYDFSLDDIPETVARLRARYPRTRMSTLRPHRDRPHPLLRDLPPAGDGAGPVQHRRGPPRRRGDPPRLPGHPPRHGDDPGRQRRAPARPGDPLRRPGGGRGAAAAHPRPHPRPAPTLAARHPGA